ARDDLFDYVTWEVGALWDKARQELFGVQSYLDDTEGHALVIAYLDRVAAAQQIEARIEAAYADPDIDDPAAATADLRAERDALRAQLAADQPLVESIIESQVSAVLADEGFDVLGQVMPPVSMHFTEIPTALIVSPRDRIAYAVDLNLNALTVEEREALETEIDTELDVASLIVPLGGLSLYPSMIIETARPARAFEVTAHEWSHHYLIFFPLGWEYGVRPETRIINETVATFAGHEIAQKVMARYYPDLPPPVYPSFLATPAPADPVPDMIPEPARDPDTPEPFDFARELDRTRRQVDFLLWQGRIAAAETYMEARRREFARHGYVIRKLNQAYFAFYGGYQGSPGAGGSDPIGPAVEELRLLSPDFKTWLDTLADITTRADLLAAVEAARSTPRVGGASR
ncbi:MAG: hypothetical protein JXQ72_09030, partial [Anaerolineae bacterium]|nr:hypothetical protein [Anaerolineae bacterium]